MYILIYSHEIVTTTNFSFFLLKYINQTDYYKSNQAFLPSIEIQHKDGIFDANMAILYFSHLNIHY